MPMEAAPSGGLGVVRLARLGPSRGSCVIGAEDGPYQAVDGATPWAAGKQVWVPRFPERRQAIALFLLNV